MRRQLEDFLETIFSGYGATPIFLVIFSALIFYFLYTVNDGIRKDFPNNFRRIQLFGVLLFLPFLILSCWAGGAEDIAQLIAGHDTDEAIDRYFVLEKLPIKLMSYYIPLAAFTAFIGLGYFYLQKGKPDPTEKKLEDILRNKWLRMTLV